MIKKTITYENPFTEQQVTEEHHFHLSKADFVELQMENHNAPEITDPESGQKLDGFRAKLQAIINAEDAAAVLVVVKDLVRRSYGKKEGDKFLKSSAIWAEFEGSGAYSELLYELSTDAEASAAFMQAIVPKSLLAEASDAAKAGVQVPSPTQTAPAPETPAQAKVETALAPEAPTPYDPTGLTTPSTPQVLSQQQIVDMDPAELKSGLAEGRFKLA